MPVIMVQGAGASAGKTQIAAGLCRVFARRGFSVAPFKPVSTAPFSVQIQDKTVARVVCLLSQAAKTPARADNNPVYARPVAGGYELYVRGVFTEKIGQRELRARLNAQQDAVRAAYAALQQTADVIVIEGSGSPSPLDGQPYLANMGAASIANAPVLLTGDIDRGGVFAALAGTLEVLSQDDRSRVMGFVVNKFRGDVALLQSGLDMIADITGVRVLGVTPYCHLAVEEEDDLGDGDPTRIVDDALRDSELNRWADVLEESLDMDAVRATMGL